jgi:hypothetical protein
MAYPSSPENTPMTDQDRIAQLQASQDMLMSQCVDWRDKAEKADHRIAELEAFVHAYTEHPDLYNGPLHNKARALLGKNH